MKLKKIWKPFCYKIFMSVKCLCSDSVFFWTGKADCPYYAKAELLADLLQSILPDFCIHKICMLPSAWEVETHPKPHTAAMFHSVSLFKESVCVCVTLPVRAGLKTLAHPMAGSTRAAPWCGGSWPTVEERACCSGDSVIFSNMCRYYQ